MKLRKLLKKFKSQERMLYIRCEETDGITLWLYQGRFWVHNAYALGHTAEYSLTSAEVLSDSWEVLLDVKSGEGTPKHDHVGVLRVYDEPMPCGFGAVTC